jgi:aspartyl protease family protein
MNGHLAAALVWIAIVVGGYFVIDHFSAPDPVVRRVEQGVREIVIPVARDGHFYIKGEINGQTVTFLVDTGASYVSVGADAARRARLPAGVRGFFNTANGSVEGRLVRGQRVSADVFEINSLTVAVMPGRSSLALLGQNFLRHFEVRQSADELVLRARP